MFIIGVGFIINIIMINQEQPVYTEGSPVRYVLRIIYIGLAISAIVGIFSGPTLPPILIVSITLLSFALVLYFQTSPKYIFSHRIVDEGFLVKTVVWYVLLEILFFSVGILIFFAMVKGIISTGGPGNEGNGILLLPFIFAYREFVASTASSIGVPAVLLILDICVVYYITKQKLVEHPSIVAASGGAESSVIFREFSLSSLVVVLTERRGRLFFILITAIIAFALSITIAVPYISNTFDETKLQARQELEDKKENVDLLTKASTTTELTIRESNDVHLVEAIAGLQNPVLKRVIVKVDSLSVVNAIQNIKSIEELSFELQTDYRPIENGVLYVEPHDLDGLINLHSLNFFVDYYTLPDKKDVNSIVLEIPDFSNNPNLKEFTIKSKDGLKISRLFFRGAFPESLERFDISGLGHEAAALIGFDDSGSGPDNATLLEWSQGSILKNLNTNYNLIHR